MNKLFVVAVSLVLLSACGMVKDEKKAPPPAPGPKDAYVLKNADSVRADEAFYYLRDGVDGNPGSPEIGLLSKLGILSSKTPDYTPLSYVLARKLSLLNNISAQLRDHSEDERLIESWYLVSFEFLDTLEEFQKRAKTVDTANDIFKNASARQVLADNIPGLQPTKSSYIPSKAKFMVLIDNMGKKEAGKKPSPTFPLADEIKEASSWNIIAKFAARSDRDWQEHSYAEQGLLKERREAKRKELCRRALPLIILALDDADYSLSNRTRESFTRDRAMMSKIEDVTPVPVAKALTPAAAKADGAAPPAPATPPAPAPGTPDLDFDETAP